MWSKIMTAVGSMPVLLFLVLMATSVVTRADTQRQVKFISDPGGAIVCKKAARSETCFGKTPLSLDLEFANLNESQRLYIYKTGYESKEVQVGPDSNKISVKLEKQELFPNPGEQENNDLKKLQEAINSRVGNAIYSYKDGMDQNFQLIGMMDVFLHENQRIFNFSVLVNNASVLRKLKKASRMRNQQKKHRSIMETLDQDGIFDFFNMIARSVASLPIDVIEFNVMFSKAQAVLDFDQVQEYRSRWSGRSCSGTGSSQYCVDRYDIYTVTRDVTVVDDKDVTVNYAFMADPKTLGPFLDSGIYGHLDKVNIYTNDNRKNTYELITVD